MQRKVIQQGPSSLMLSIPSKWVKINNIKKGDYLTVELANNQLIILAKDQEEEKKVSLYFKKKEEYLDRMIMTKYRDGFNEIIVKYDDPEIIELIRETLRYCLGFEIIDQTASSCTIRNISEGSDQDYPATFRRLFQIMLTIANSCWEYVEKNDEKCIKTAVDLRETLTKLQQFCLRLINKQNTYSVQQKSLEFLYVWELGAFGKMWSSLAKKELGKKPKLSANDKQFLKDIINFTHEFYKLYYNRDPKIMHALKEKLYALRERSNTLLDESKNRIMMFYLMRMMNRIYEVSLTF